MNNPGGHASWRTYDEKIHKRINHVLCEGPVCRWNVQKMQSEWSESVWKTTGFFTHCWRIKMALESFSEEHAQEVWERNWMNLEMQTTLWNTYPPKLIATILQALREQLKENDQFNAVEEIACPVPEIPLKYDQILKGGGRFWDDVNGGYLPEDFVLAARREEIGSIPKVSTRLFQRKSASVRGVSWSEVATVPKRKSHRGLDLDLSWNSEEDIWKGRKESGGTK